MKPVVIIIFLSSLLGCSVIGSELGEIVDKTTGEDKYKDKYIKEGLEADFEIIKALLTRKEEEKIEEYDGRACKESGTHQVCTTSKGCWCEKTLTKKYNAWKDRSANN